MFLLKRRFRMVNRISTLLILCGVLVSTAIASEFRRLSSAELIAEEGRLVLLLDSGEVDIRAINSGTVEVLYKLNDSEQLPSFALPEYTKPFIGGVLRQTEDGYLYQLPEVTLNIQANPFKLSFSNKNGYLTQEETGAFLYETIRGFRFALEDEERLMGGGQRILGMNRRGHRLPLYNKAHYGYNSDSSQMYFGLPAVMSDKGYAIAFDNSANGFMDLGYSEKNILQFEAEAGRTSYIFTAGEDYQQLIQNFVSATGTQPLPPRWALGNYASRFGYKSQQEVLDTIEKFIDLDFPVDAVVLDLYWFGPDIKGHMGNLTWDKVNWPEPEKMISDLNANGVKTIMITEPFILRSSSQWQSAIDNSALAKNLAGNARTFDFYFGNTGLVDVFDQNARDWFWQYYKKLNAQGVSGWWGDLGEPEVHPADTLHNMDGNIVTANEIHNVYGHRWAKMVYENQKDARPLERPFIMMRSGFIGSQRYGMIPWTGDVERSWAGLQPQVELALQMSIFGLAYIHSDLGGFAGGEEFDAELYTRWLQYGVFQPVYRPHAQDHIAPEPVFHNLKTQEIVRDFIKLRYRLLPYNYSLSIQNSMTGLPMMRPLFVEFSNASIDRTDAYMWGDSLLVAPVVEQGQSEKDVLLPHGKWFDFWTQKEYIGGKTVTIETPLERIPVFVKAGAFVPMTAPIQNTSQYNSGALDVFYYFDDTVANAEYTMFDDDGISPNTIKSKQYQSFHFTAQAKDHELEINLDVKGQYSTAPSQRDITYTIYNINALPKMIKVDGLEYDVIESDDASPKLGLSLIDELHAIYHADKRTLIIKTKNVTKNQIKIVK
ncbi:TIM-barrel domain-containing protein [Glaciecola petra]|uniref:Glycoside hydrolase family 31 protein n=1 Tax=Glaciecola petra TaxID=3075602 RepID=A0ABU2ZP96_9ALTE|nr:TIM-barrel domain-containing protein [Aestuariibacter sp. P117]MDT0594451.1 glycoside hydrolase family 31 protein [Aestuariibacter sp. P117]